VDHRRLVTPLQSVRGAAPVSNPRPQRPSRDAADWPPAR
jgi:hypothetical protein